MILSVFYFKGDGQIREIVNSECKQTLAVYGEENAPLLEEAIGVLYYRYNTALYDDLVRGAYKVKDGKLILKNQDNNELEQI